MTETVPAKALMDLLTAWQLWDAKPGGEREANTMEDAAKAVAGHLGIDTSRLRDRLSAGRHQGMDHREAIRAAVTDPAR